MTPSTVRGPHGAVNAVRAKVRRGRCLRPLRGRSGKVLGATSDLFRFTCRCRRRTLCAGTPRGDHVMPACLALAALTALLPLAAPPHLAQAQGKKYALVVGIATYDSVILEDLDYAENDAEELAKVFKDAGYEVVVLTTLRGKKDKQEAPTAANVRQALKDLSGKAKKDDLLLLALSGHGARWRGSDHPS